MGNSNPYRPPSIADYGGIEKYLDHPDIVAKHNGHGLKDIRRWLTEGLSMPKIAQNITPEGRKVFAASTVRGWKIKLGL